MRSNRSGAVATVLAAAMVIMAACSSPPSVLRWPPAAPLRPLAQPWHSPATALVCRVADIADGITAVYYLEVHSAAFDFDPCKSGIARIPIHLGYTQTLLDTDIRQRCMYSAATDDSVNGYVNVLTTAEPTNIRAADRLCIIHHGVPRQ